MNKTRRKVLSTSGAVLCAGLAGCSRFTDTATRGGRADVFLYNGHDVPATMSIRAERHDDNEPGDPLLDKTIDLKAGEHYKFNNVLPFDRLFDVTASTGDSTSHSITWKAKQNGLHILYSDLSGVPPIWFARYAEDQT